jgi:hypothetical protein
MVAQHQRQQAPGLGLVWHELNEYSSQTDGLGGQVEAATVPFIEDKIDDREDGREALGQEVGGWNAERNARLLQLGLGPGEAPLHRFHRYKEGPGNLFGREAAECTEGQRHLRLHRQGRVAAHKHELEALVGEH